MLRSALQWYQLKKTEGNVTTLINTTRDWISSYTGCTKTSVHNNNNFFFKLHLFILKFHYKYNIKQRYQEKIKNYYTTHYKAWHVDGKSHKQSTNSLIPDLSTLCLLYRKCNKYYGCIHLLFVSLESQWTLHQEITSKVLNTNQSYL